MGQRLVGDWEISTHVGSGSFAIVWKARHRLTGQEAAIKEINLDKLNSKLRQSLESEVSILQKINHENIVQLLEVFEEKSRLYLVMEYCAGGDLAHYIRAHKRAPEAVARHFMRQLAAGLREMWGHHLVHRDLKPQNLLLDSPGPGARLKIADFGFARNLQPAGLAETLCGSPLYMAPEILHFHKYDAKADLWSVGAILFELVAGRPPFNGANQFQLLRNIERNEARLPDVVASQLSLPCRQLIHALLRRNPVERISFEEFFQHPFLTGPPSPPLPSPFGAAPLGRSFSANSIPQQVLGFKEGPPGSAAAGGGNGNGGAEATVPGTGGPAVVPPGQLSNQLKSRRSLDLDTGVAAARAAMQQFLPPGGRLLPEAGGAVAALGLSPYQQAPQQTPERGALGSQLAALASQQQHAQHAGSSGGALGAGWTQPLARALPSAPAAGSRGQNPLPQGLPAGSLRGTPQESRPGAVMGYSPSPPSPYHAFGSAPPGARPLRDLSYFPLAAVPAPATSMGALGPWPTTLPAYPQAWPRPAAAPAVPSPPRPQLQAAAAAASAGLVAGSESAHSVDDDDYVLVDTVISSKSRPASPPTSVTTSQSLSQQGQPAEDAPLAPVSPEEAAAEGPLAGLRAGRPSPWAGAEGMGSAPRWWLLHRAAHAMEQLADGGWQQPLPQPELVLSLCLASLQVLEHALDALAYSAPGLASAAQQQGQLQQQPPLPSSGERSEARPAGAGSVWGGSSGGRQPPQLAQQGQQQEAAAVKAEAKMRGDLVRVLEKAEAAAAALAAAAQQQQAGAGATSPGGGGGGPCTGDANTPAPPSMSSALAAAAGMALPDPWELCYNMSLVLAKDAAVDELLCNQDRSLQLYTKACCLLYFLCMEGPSLALEPPLQLGEEDRLRLQRYAAATSARWVACKAQVDAERAAAAAEATAG